MNKLKNAIIHISRNPAYIRPYVQKYLSIVEIYVAFIISFPFRKKLSNKNIWLIREKGTEARDNGYHLYKYVREKHPTINCFYVIAKDSADSCKVEKYGNVIMLNSLKHFIYYLHAKVSANSQAYGASPDPSDLTFQAAKKLHRKDQVVVHLKHGITKDQLPHSLDYANTKFDLLCCVSERERRFMQEVHGYPEDNIKAIGFCRFDNLLSQHYVKKQVLIMPTFRVWLQAIDIKNDATESEKKTFMESEYYKAYQRLLSDERIIELVKEKGYSIVFYPHYAIQSFIGCFDNTCDIVTIANREHYDVQQLLMESAILITDYSSVFFDFSYMEKPVIYYQFDESEYRSKHYKKGYYDYHLDGFGPVCKNVEQVRNQLEYLFENNLQMNDIYKQRIQSFFSIKDTNNCERIFEEIWRKAIAK